MNFTLGPMSIHILNFTAAFKSLMHWQDYPNVRCSGYL
jgi:hypothetical protein